MRSYRVEYLPVAREDIVGIASYVAGELRNPSAARRLSHDLVSGAESLAEMPYRQPVYRAAGPLRHEYRCLRVGNYVVFYWVEEDPEPVVTVARVLYGRRDVGTLLP